MGFLIISITIVYSNITLHKVFGPGFRVVGSCRIFHVQPTAHLKGQATRTIRGLGFGI